MKKLIKLCIHHKYLLVLVGLAFFRVTLLAGTSWELIPGTGYDDIMQMKNAAAIISGNWLGDHYFYTTLPKTIGFPFFLALGKWLGLPYGIWYGCYIVFAGFIFIKAIEPMVRNKKILLLLYGVVIFTPINHEAAFRIYRNALIPWTFLLVFSSLVAVFIRRREAFKKQLPWSLAGLLSVAVFWTLREDSVWILPFVLGVILVTIFAQVLLNWNDKPKALGRSLLATFPLLGIVLANILVSSLNYKHYGIYAMNDRTQTYAPKVMSLLYRIDDGKNENPHVWASRRAFELAIEASPTFKTEEEIILSAYGLWAGDKTDITGDISQWALRFGLSEVGYYQNNAQKTNQFYQKVYEELSAAFDRGDLKKKPGIYLSSQTGAFQLSDFWESFIMAVDVSFRTSFYAHTDLKDSYLTYPDFTEGDLTFFEYLLSTDLPRTEKQLKDLGFDGTYADYDKEITSLANTNALNNQSLIEKRQRNLSQQMLIIKLYQLLSFILVPLAWLAYLLLLVRLVKASWKIDDQTWNYFLIVTGLALIGFLNNFIVILFSRWITKDTSHPVIGFYASSSYIVFTLAMIFSCLTLMRGGKPQLAPFLDKLLPFKPNLSSSDRVKKEF